MGCHKNILSSSSDVFQRMFASTSFTEGREGLLSIEDLEPKSVENLLEFIYTDKINTKELSVHELCDLLKASDKYNISQLKSYVGEKLIACITKVNVLGLAIQSNLFKANHLFT